MFTKEQFLLIPTFSPQGDGNALLKASEPSAMSRVDPYLFPARGRKLHASIPEVGLTLR